MDVLLTLLFYVYAGLVISMPLLVMPARTICRRSAGSPWKTLVVLVPVIGLPLFASVLNLPGPRSRLGSQTAFVAPISFQAFQLTLAAALALPLTLPLPALLHLAKQARLPPASVLMTIVPFANVVWLSLVARRIAQ
jgi:hypothetical protein